MLSEDKVVDPLMGVQFNIKSKSFFQFVLKSIYCFFLQKALKSVFVPRYESLKLNHATNYLMESEDTVEDPLMSFQFYINSKKVFFTSFYSPSTVFIFIAKDRRLNLYFYHAMSL